MDTLKQLKQDFINELRGPSTALSRDLFMIIIVTGLSIPFMLTLIDALDKF